MKTNGKAPQLTNGALLDEPIPPPSAVLIGAGIPAQVAPLTLQDAETPAHEPAASARRIAAGTRGTIEAQLVNAQIAIDTVAADPQLQAAMAAHGYGAEQMRAGQALRERAQALYNQQRAGYGESFAATDARASAQAQAHAIYMRHVAIARVALRGDRGAEQALGVAAARKLTQTGWQVQAEQFYANLFNNRAIQQKLAAFGVTTEQLSQAQRMVAGVTETLMAQQASKGAAVALTRERDAALAALKEWMRDFRAIARVALAEQQG